jgi:hypothetical protein
LGGLHDALVTGVLDGPVAVSEPEVQVRTHALRVEIDRTFDHSLVTFQGAIVVETQTALHGVISMFQGEKVVVVDLADVWATDQHGLDALQILFDAPITSVYVVDRTLGPASQELGADAVVPRRPRHPFLGSCGGLGKARNSA